MKRISAVLVLAVLGFALAGCGSAKSGSAPVVINTIDTHSPSGMIVVKGKKTFANLPVGTPIACTGGEPLVNVPAGVLAEGVSSSSLAAVSGPAPAEHMDLTRASSGRVTVSCSRR